MRRLRALVWVLLADEVAGLHLPPSRLVSTPALTLDVTDPKAMPLYRDGAANYLLCYEAETGYKSLCLNAAARLSGIAPGLVMYRGRKQRATAQ